MSDIDLLLMTPLMPSVMAELEAGYRVHRFYEQDDRAAFLSATGARIRAIATTGHAGADNALIDALPALEIIAGFGVGYDAIDVGHATARRVLVTNTPDVLNDDVANLAVGLLLAVSRGIVRGDRFVREGRWLQGEMGLMRSIRDKPVGILGLGRIGTRIAGKLDAFGCDVAYHGRREQPEQPYRYYPELVPMAAECDYLIVICPATEATRNLVGREVLDALGPRGTLINVARGSVVDEPQLVAALEERRLGAAALDVFADEPRVPAPLLAMDNVVLQPHQASATVETRQAMGDLMLENLALHFAGKPVATPVAG